MDGSAPNDLSIVDEPLVLWLEGTEFRPSRVGARGGDVSATVDDRWPGGTTIVVVTPPLPIDPRCSFWVV